MKRKIGIMVFCVLSVSLVATVFAQDEVSLLDSLREQLREREWSGEEVGRLIQAANALQWEGTNPEHAEVVAMALQFSRQEGEHLVEPEYARLALQLALGAREMEELGFRKREIARASLECTREIMGELRQGVAREDVLAGDPTPLEQNEMTLRMKERVRSTIQGRIRDELPPGVRQRQGEAGGGPQNGGRPGAGKPGHASGGR